MHPTGAAKRAASGAHSPQKYLIAGSPSRQLIVTALHGFPLEVGIAADQPGLGEVPPGVDKRSGGLHLSRRQARAAGTGCLAARLGIPEASGRVTGPDSNEAADALRAAGGAHRVTLADRTGVGASGQAAETFGAGDTAGGIAVGDNRTVGRTRGAAEILVTGDVAGREGLVNCGA
jgi:hypothetical protein